MVPLLLTALPCSYVVKFFSFVSFFSKPDSSLWTKLVHDQFVFSIIIWQYILIGGDRHKHMVMSTQTHRYYERAQHPVSRGHEEQWRWCTNRYPRLWWNVLCPPNKTTWFFLQLGQQTSVWGLYKGHDCVRIDDTLVNSEKRTLESILPGIEQQVEEIMTASYWCHRKEIFESEEHKGRKPPQTKWMFWWSTSQQRKQLQDDISSDGDQREVFGNTKNGLLTLSRKLQ